MKHPPNHARVRRALPRGIAQLECATPFVSAAFPVAAVAEAAAALSDGGFAFAAPAAALPESVRGAALSLVSVVAGADAAPVFSSALSAALFASA